jgi:hypothetical protein
MERAARLLLASSLVAFAVVIGLGTLRASPAHQLLDVPEALKSLQSFHSHFDVLVWLGAAALGATLKLLAPGYRGPAWAPRLLAPAYLGGATVFACSFAMKALGQRLGLDALVRPVAPALASLGGVGMLLAALAALVVARSSLAAAREPAPGDDAG